MSGHLVSKRALAAVHAVCASGWPAELLVPNLLQALHAVVPSQRNLFDFTDSQGRLLRYFIEGPVDTALAQHYFEHFHNQREAECMPAFAALGRMPAGVRPASELDHSSFFASALYHEVWRPQGMHTRIEGVVRSAAGQLLGSLVLYRGPGDVPFNSADERRLAALLPRIASGLQACAQNMPAAVSACMHVPVRDNAESLLLDTDGRVRFASPGAERLLMLADGGISRDALSMPLEHRVARLFGRLLLQMQARQASPVLPSLQPWPSLSILNAYGRFDAQGALLQPSGGPGSDAALLQINLRRLEPRAVAVKRVLLNMPISLGQASVCEALYAGHAQTEIARSLGVATSTVVDHVRKLYRALDVVSAAGLRERLDRDVALAAG